MKRHERRVRAVASRWLGRAAFGRPLPIVLARLRLTQQGSAWARVIVGRPGTLDDARLAQCLRWVGDMVYHRMVDRSEAAIRRLRERETRHVA